MSVTAKLAVPRCKCGAQVIADGIEALDVYAGSLRGPLVETHGRASCTLTVGKQPDGWKCVVFEWRRDVHPQRFSQIYRAYAADHNRTAEEMLVVDRLTYPGGSMAGFIVWVSQQREKGRIV